MNQESRIKNLVKQSSSPTRERAGVRLGILLIIPVLILASGIFYKKAFTPDFDQYQNLPLSDSPPVPTTTLLAVGDIMLSRHVGFQIGKSNDPALPFAKLVSLLAAADITSGNLECPLSDSQIPIREGLVFRCLTKYVPGLLAAGFDVLSTANNHSFDQGIDKLNFTVDYLRSQNILPFGTGKNFAEAHAGSIIERNHINFGFLAYSYSAFNDGKRSAHPQIATTADYKQLHNDIQNLRSQGADIVVVNMHEGAEYQRKPNQNQIAFAHAAIDAGADIVIGHHPHWIQTIEIYNQRPIFYSLGNFVFDQMWSIDTREGLVVKLNFKNKQFISAELVPIIIDNYCCPRLASDKEKTAILKKINLESDTLVFPSP